MIVIIYYKNFIRYSSQAVDVCGPTVRPRGKTPQQCLISEESKTRLGNVDRDGRSPLNSVPDLTFVSAWWTYVTNIRHKTTSQNWKIDRLKPNLSISGQLVTHAAIQGCAVRWSFYKAAVWLTLKSILLSTIIIYIYFFLIQFFLLEKQKKNHSCVLDKENTAIFGNCQAKSRAMNGLSRKQCYRGLLESAKLYKM